MASVQRQPFAELGASRLQGLTSQKNCQNAISDAIINTAKPSFAKPQPTPAHKKRAFVPADDDSDADTENQDPALLFSKNSKVYNETPSKKMKLNVIPHALAPPSSNGIPTPTSPLFDKSSSTLNAFTFPTTSGANSAPAGRSPKQRRAGLLGKKRSTMSPFKRVNPPAFGPSSCGGLPFSIDAALNGTLSGSRGSKTVPAPAPMPSQTVTAMPAPKVATIEESMPSGWFFEIHEDTPQEEAANLMEHSTGILDISSDDEASPRKKVDRGKENIPPADVVSSNRVPAAERAGKTARRSDPDAMQDVDEVRTPLESLNAEEFYGHGLTHSSVEVVKTDAEPESEQKADLDAFVSTPAPVMGSVALDEAESKNGDSHTCVENSAQPFKVAQCSSSGKAQAGDASEAGLGFEIAVDKECVEA